MHWIPMMKRGYARIYASKLILGHNCRLYRRCRVVAWSVRVGLVKEACDNLSHVSNMAYKHKYEQFPAFLIPFHLPSFPEALILGFARSDKKPFLAFMVNQ